MTDTTQVYRSGVEFARSWLNAGLLESVSLLEAISAVNEKAQEHGFSEPSLKMVFINAFLEEIQRQISEISKIYTVDALEKFREFGMVDAVRWVTSTDPEFIRGLSEEDRLDVAEKLFHLWHRSEQLPQQLRHIYLESFTKHTEILIRYL